MRVEPCGHRIGCRPCLDSIDMASHPFLCVVCRAQAEAVSYCAEVTIAFFEGEAERREARRLSRKGKRSLLTGSKIVLSDSEAAALASAKKSQEGELRCLKCWAHKRVMRANPCGHFLYCADCAPRKNALCDICSREVLKWTVCADAVANPLYSLPFLDHSL
jgi:hypothetical protein